jgi:hypothetical protein
MRVAVKRGGTTLRIRIRILLAAAVAATTLVTVSTPAAAAPGVKQPFAAQAIAAHLTAGQTSALQAKVDEYLKVVGGQQVALNLIAFDGGQLWVAIPGEAHPRTLVSPATLSRVSPAAIHVAAYDPCNTYLSGWFCAFSQTSFQGSELSWYYCGTYNMPWTGYGAWQNDQTQGTKAQFLDYSYGVRYTTAGAYSGSASENWTPVFHIKPC